MKILLIADKAEPTLWEHLDKRKLEGVELVLSCGDLPASYLSFLTCFTPAPILYIHGNHDDRYASAPPEGCICIEDTIYTYKGIRILGLGGSMRYNNGINQYTEKQMRARVGRLRFKLWRSGGITRNTCVTGLFTRAIALISNVSAITERRRSSTPADIIFWIFPKKRSAIHPKSNRNTGTKRREPSLRTCIPVFYSFLSCARLKAHRKQTTLTADTFQFLQRPFHLPP